MTQTTPDRWENPKDKEETNAAYQRLQREAVERNAVQEIAELRQEIVCLNNALDECDQIIVNTCNMLLDNIPALASDFASQATKETLNACAKAQNEMKARIRDATGKI